MGEIKTAAPFPNVWEGLGFGEKYLSCRVPSAEIIILVGWERKSSKSSLYYSNASLPWYLKWNLEILLCRGKKIMTSVFFRRTVLRLLQYITNKRAQPLGDLVISAEHVSLMQLNYDCKFIKQGKITGIYIKPHQWALLRKKIGSTDRYQSNNQYAGNGYITLL